MIALAVLLSIQISFAQVKSKDAVLKSIETAKLATENPKKALKVATWTKLAETLVDAYSAPAGAGWRGASQQELQLILANDKAKSSETVELSGAVYRKDVFSTRNYYYNQEGLLEMIEITKPYYKNALKEAVAAYKKAYEVDAKKSKTEDIAKGLSAISSKYLEDAVMDYNLGKMSESSRDFEAAAKAAATEPCSITDSMAIYNAGFTAWMAGENERAKKFFAKAEKIGYYDKGEVYAKLADVNLKLADTLAVKIVLEEGFARFPQNQNILIGLINYYITSGESTEQLFVLLDKAKVNEPNNASLYYVEGDIHNKLGNKDAAIASYRKSTEINPEYEFGYIGEGILLYNEAVKISEAAAMEMDDNKYMAMVEEYEKYLLDASAPFEKGFEVSKDDNIKVNIAEYLKNIYYRFRDKDAKYQAGYDKYADIVSKGTAN